jgi:MoxR-like ATPase
MQQKDQLRQDMFLIGATGALRRWLALHWCAINGRAVEYLALTRDTTESDIKQRREIRHGGTSVYEDQAAVRAALHGRVLILEGIEKCERNVLPVLNNLIENREMALSDGRFIVAPHRLAELHKSKRKKQKKKLVAAHPDFRVIALGVPVPPYPGNRLDPPLRSRFQASRVDHVPVATLWHLIRRWHAPHRASQRVLKQLLGFAASVQQQTDVPSLHETSIFGAARCLEFFPHSALRAIVLRVYPFTTAVQNAEALALLSRLLDAAVSLHSSSKCSNTEYLITSATTTTTTTTKASSLTQPASMMTMKKEPEQLHNVELAFNGGAVRVRVHGGVAPPHLPPLPQLQQQQEHRSVSALLQSHAVNRDLCVYGARGGGKTTLVRLFARVLGYSARVEPLYLFKDMSTRDLLQRRTTTQRGVTVWQNSPLVRAVQHGSLAVLDGIHRLASGTLSVLTRLVQDRELELFDGSRFIRADRFAFFQRQLGMSAAQLNTQLRLFAVHPRFRLVVTAELPRADKGATAAAAASWLDHDTIALFDFHHFDLTLQTQPAHTAGKANAKAKAKAARLQDMAVVTRVVQRIVPQVPQAILCWLAEVCVGLRALCDDPILQLDRDATLSLRQLLRVARRAVVYPHESVDTLKRVLMVDMMVLAKRNVVLRLLRQTYAAIVQKKEQKKKKKKKTYASIAVLHQGTVLQIGEARMRLRAPQRPELVPSVLFYDIPMHTLILEALLKDFALVRCTCVFVCCWRGGTVACRFMRFAHFYYNAHVSTVGQSLVLCRCTRRGQKQTRGSLLAAGATRA